MFSKKLDFSNPLQARNWLSILEPHPKFGFLIRKNFSCSNKSLGFSFNSNELGLRGPSNQFSEIVFIGTSYTMGFGVNNGDNWWDKIDNPNRFFLNLGLPVGILEWLELIQAFWKNDKKKLVLLYHPNWLSHEKNYSYWRTTGLTVHQAFGWKTSMQDCLKLYLKKAIQSKKSNTRFLYEKIGGEKYRFDSEYSFFHGQMPYQSLDKLSDFVSQCKSVVMIRLFCKEEIFAKINPKYSQFQDLASHHEANWVFVKNYLTQKTNIKIKDSNPSTIQSYLPRDTHLSVRGNFELAHCIKNIIDNDLK